MVRTLYLVPGTFVDPSALDFPQLYTKPSYTTLIKVLNAVKLPPPSWDAPTSYHEPKGLSRYLTTIISSCLAWIEDEESKEYLWELASERLAERCGRTGRADMERAFRIPLLVEDLSCLDISLHEPALTGDSLGLKTWGSAYTLSKRLCRLRSDGILPEPSEKDAALELGSGTGLVGMAFAGVFGTETLLTDLPDIVPNLKRNIESNGDKIAVSGGRCQASVLDWCNLPAEDDLEWDFANSFKYVLAADPIYSPEHPKLLIGAVQRFLSRDGGRFVVEMPIRRGFHEERDSFRALMNERGFEVVNEGISEQRDDWSSEMDQELEGWWSVWKWKE